MVDEEEVPKNSAVNFIIESAAQIDDKKNEVKNKDISVIFCIDQSGSMCCTSPIEGKFKLRGDKTSQINEELRAFMDGSDQFLNNSEKNVTYVSRM